MPGIPASELDDERLLREMTHLHQTRHDTVVGGPAHALTAHTERMLELEAEWLQRSPGNAAPDERRLRASSRARAGQDPEASAETT